MNHKIILSLLSLFFVLPLQAQEEITPAFTNPKLFRPEKRAQVFSTDTLSLPFLDDFSVSRHYPDTLKWVDDHVFINTTMPVNPPSLGVATFDGLRSNGFGYAQNQPNAYGIADYLTSHYFDLSTYSPADSIYLTFAYQPQGIGNDPQPADSLVLQFSVNDSTWYHVWSVPGSALKGFKFVSVPVTDNIYLRNDFRFRFLNYASLAGSFDHWHLDYVYINNGRTRSDTVFQDVAFINQAKPLLKTYYEMPWNHYTSSDLKDSLIISAKNNYIQAANVPYQYTVKDGQGNVIAQSTGLSGNINAGEIMTFRNKLNSFSLNPGGPYEEFLIENVISPSPDFNRWNDTVRQYQRFDQHYAYDDGSGEAGYSLNAFGAQLAYKFKINTSDKLTAVGMSWNFANNNMEQSAFRFTVWADDNGKPGAMLMEKDSVWYPQYHTVNGYVIYKLNNNELSLSPGTYHFGWVQVDNSRLNIGFDRNHNNQDKIHYNVTGTWLPSNTVETGSLMMRPIFGDPQLPVSTEEKAPINNLKIFPNPASDMLTIHSAGFLFAEVLNLQGQVLIRDHNPTFSVAGIPSGPYLVKVTGTDGSVLTRRLIVFH